MLSSLCMCACVYGCVCVCVCVYIQVVPRLRRLGVAEEELVVHIIGPNMNHQTSVAHHLESKVVRLHGRVRGPELDALFRTSKVSLSNAHTHTHTHTHTHSNTHTHTHGRVRGRQLDALFRTSKVSVPHAHTHTHTHTHRSSSPRWSLVRLPSRLRI
jgi:hypothetical protein